MQIYKKKLKKTNYYIFFIKHIKFHYYFLVISNIYLYICINSKKKLMKIVTFQLSIYLYRKET